MCSGGIRGRITWFGLCIENIDWSRRPKVSHQRTGEWPRSLALDFYTNIRCELASPANGQIPSNTCTRKGNGELGKQKCSVLVAEF